ncbi:MAG: hypothetical protein IT331_25615 [Anaerolineae bacterium]|nr:hypothetical protein [Anaerolineae bacterium]
MGKNKQLVLAFFATESAADNAVNELKNWDKASKEIKLGSIGILVKDDKGKIKTQKLGARHTGAGVVLGAVAGVLTGGLSLLGGAVIGGVLGTLMHKGLGMSKEDLARISGELDGGKAAVGVLADDSEAAAVSAKLAELGGKPETHEVTEEAVQQAAAAVDAASTDTNAETPAA